MTSLSLIKGSFLSFMYTNPLDVINNIYQEYIDPGKGAILTVSIVMFIIGIIMLVAFSFSQIWQRRARHIIFMSCLGFLLVGTIQYWQAWGNHTSAKFQFILPITQAISFGLPIPPLF